MLETFIVSMYLGQYLSGALIGGLIPFIIAFIKKRWGLGVMAFILCGAAALLHSVASIVVGIVFIVIAIKSDPA